MHDYTVPTGYTADNIVNELAKKMDHLIATATNPDVPTEAGMYMYNRYIWARHMFEGFRLYGVCARRAAC